MQAVISLLTAHKNWLVLTGAGVSAESGVPTYRNSKGVWQRKQPVTHQDFMAQHDCRHADAGRRHFVSPSKKPAPTVPISPVRGELNWAARRL